jgi:hypothetical protein
LRRAIEAAGKGYVLTVTSAQHLGLRPVGAGQTHEGLRSYRWGPLGEGTGAETLQNPATGGVSWQNADLS